MANLNLFYIYLSGKCFSELVELVSALYFRDRSACYSDSLRDFFVTVSRLHQKTYASNLSPNVGGL